MSTNQLITGIIEPHKIAVAYASTADLVSEVARRRQTDPVATHVCGRAITAALLVAATSCNEQQRLNVRWAYAGLLRTLVVDVGGDASLRALVSPGAFPEAASKDELLGDQCRLSVVKSAGGKALASGTCDSILQNVADDLAFYCSTSDQVETGITTLIQLRNTPQHPVALCHGIMLQAMPDANLAVFDALRQRMIDPAWRELLGSEHPAKPTQTLVEHLFDGVAEQPSLTLHTHPEPRFHCPCHRDKMAAVLKTLPYTERMELVKKGETVVVTCEFCATRYELSIETCIRAWNDQPLDP